LITSDKRVDARILAAKPELLYAYMEWGVCEIVAGLAEKSNAQQERASSIFDLLLTNTTRESPLWWNAKYQQMRTLYRRGIYQQASVAMNSLVRATENDFAKAPAQLKPLLLSLRTDIEKMIH